MIRLGLNYTRKHDWGAVIVRDGESPLVVDEELRSYNPLNSSRQLVKLGIRYRAGLAAARRRPRSPFHDF